MHIGEGVRLALAQLRAQKLKSFFSLLGVIIGVGFMLVVVSVVEGIDRYIRDDFASEIFGFNTITLQSAPASRVSSSGEVLRDWTRRKDLTYEDAQAIREQLRTPAVVGVGSGRQGGQVQADNGKKVENVFLAAVSPELLQIRSLVVEKGRPFSERDEEIGAPVVILGTRTAEVLFDDLDPIGRRVRIGNARFRVIGVFEEQGSLLGIVSLDNRAIAPATSPMRAIAPARGAVGEILVQPLRTEDFDAARAEVEGIMRGRHRLQPILPNDFEIETAEEALGIWDNISRVLFIVLPGMVAISLVVGAIVIMNITLVSVLERTREIGVRKALGARRRDILGQVLIESATLSLVGALIGIGIGIAFAAVTRALSPLPAGVDPLWIGIGLLLGVLVGIFAGVYPASRAARLDPVDALRYE